MKYDTSKKLTKGQIRTLDAFSKAMFLMLANNSFEEITVGQLCDNVSYPRATFYNYFDDKYDLLNYCWYTLAKKIKLDEYRHCSNDEMLYLYFDRICDFTKENIKIIEKILSHNSEVAYMFSSFHNFLNNYMRQIFKDCPDASKKEIPNELLADHYSNTLLLVWQYLLLNKRCTKKQAYDYLNYLVKNL